MYHRATTSPRQYALQLVIFKLDCMVSIECEARWRRRRMGNLTFPPKEFALLLAYLPRRLIVMSRSRILTRPPRYHF